MHSNNVGRQGNSDGQWGGDPKVDGSLVLLPAHLPDGFDSIEEYVNYCACHGVTNPARRW